MRTAVIRFGVMGLIVLIVGTYVALVGLYEGSVEVVPANNLTDNPDQSSATLTVEEMQSNYSAVVANLAVSPGTALLDPTTHRLKEDLVVRVRSAATPSPASTPRACFPVFFRSR